MGATLAFNARKAPTITEALAPGCGSRAGLGTVDEERHDRIRAAVAAIPEGRVATYGDVAAAAGERSARVVGWVLRDDGADLPWHRVLRADGSSAPHILDEQHARLRAEGVEIRDGRVVLANHRVASGWISWR